jgi:hypothetical protein
MMENINYEPGEKAQIVNEFTINPKTGKLISEGHEYENTPRTRDLIRRANVIRKSFPPLQSDHVRLWRGNRPGEVGENSSYTNSLEGVALPFLDKYEGELSYVEIPKADLDKYLCSSGVAVDSEFILPSELAKTARVVQDSLRPKPVIREKSSNNDEIIQENPNNPRGWGKV